MRDRTDRDVLKLLREETTLLVLMVRVHNQEWQEAWEEKNKLFWEEATE